MTDTEHQLLAASERTERAIAAWAEEEEAHRVTQERLTACRDTHRAISRLIEERNTTHFEALADTVDETEQAYRNGALGELSAIGALLLDNATDRGE